MHAERVKRLQILIENDLYAELERISTRTGRSKSALIREFIRKQIRPFLPFDEDPLFSLAGAFSFPPADIDSTLCRDIKRRGRRSGRRSLV
jgi:hypothetical protein